MPFAVVWGGRGDGLLVLVALKLGAGQTVGPQRRGPRQRVISDLLRQGLGRAIGRSVMVARLGLCGASAPGPREAVEALIAAVAVDGRLRGEDEPVAVASSREAPRGGRGDVGHLGGDALAALGTDAAY